MIISEHMKGLPIVDKQCFMYCDGMHTLQNVFQLIDIIRFGIRAGGRHNVTNIEEHL